MNEFRGALDVFVRADNAYKRARRAVYDRLPPGAPIDDKQLTDEQREILLELHDADAALSAYRESQYAHA